MRRLLVPATLVGLWACGQERPEEPAPARPGTPRPRDDIGYREIDVELGGSVSGRVVWSGERPPEVSVPAAGEGCDPGPVAVLEVGPRGGLSGVVVVLSGISEGRARETGETTLRMVGCRLAPHVVAVPSGSTLRIENADPRPHNAHATDPAGSTRFDLGLPQGAPVALSLDRPGILRVVDDAANPGGMSWIHVIEHPYFAVTDASGTFRLTSVPPGQYTLQVWHEGVRSSGLDADGRPHFSAPILLSRLVTVVGGQDTAADFSMDLRLADAAGE
jgi:hypothetical protein